MAYASITDVQNRNQARGTYTANSIPNASSVSQFIDDAQAQVDSWLFSAGYDAPFDTAIASGMIATSMQHLLRRWTVTGAVLYVEQASQDSDREPWFKEMWDEVQKAIENMDLALPRNELIALPRQSQPPARSPFGFTMNPNDNRL